jgi:hypothetical protein
VNDIISIVFILIEIANKKHSYTLSNSDGFKTLRVRNVLKEQGGVRFLPWGRRRKGFDQLFIAAFPIAFRNPSLHLHAFPTAPLPLVGNKKSFEHSRF